MADKQREKAFKEVAKWLKEFCVPLNGWPANSWFITDQELEDLENGKLPEIKE